MLISRIETLSISSVLYLKEYAHILRMEMIFEGYVGELQNCMTVRNSNRMMG